MSRYIDADKLKKFFPDDGEGNWTYNVTAKSYIDSQPTADVRENVHGEWIFNHMSQLWECSNCHKEEIRTTDFCPKCGADIRTKETDCDYERAVDQLEHDMLYEPTFNQDDGSM